MNSNCHYLSCFSDISPLSSLWANQVHAHHRAFAFITASVHNAFSLVFFINFLVYHSDLESKVISSQLLFLKEHLTLPRLSIPFSGFIFFMMCIALEIHCHTPTKLITVLDILDHFPIHHHLGKVYTFPVHQSTDLTAMGHGSASGWKWQWVYGPCKISPAPFAPETLTCCEKSL